MERCGFVFVRDFLFVKILIHWFRGAAQWSCILDRQRSSRSLLPCTRSLSPCTRSLSPESLALSLSLSLSLARSSIKPLCPCPYCRFSSLSLCLSQERRTETLLPLRIKPQRETIPLSEVSLPSYIILLPNRTALGLSDDLIR